MNRPVIQKMPMSGNRMMDRLKKKYKHGPQNTSPARWFYYYGTERRLGSIAFGSTESAVLEAQHQLATEHGLKADFMRVRAIPFTDEVTAFVKKIRSDLYRRNETVTDRWASCSWFGISRTCRQF